MPTKPTRKPNKLEPKRLKWAATDFKYNSIEWIKLRNKRRRDEPLCRECSIKGIIKPGSVVDHIQPIRFGGEPYDFENTQTLCESCHNSKSAKESKIR